MKRSIVGGDFPLCFTSKEERDHEPWTEGSEEDASDATMDAEGYCVYWQSSCDLGVDIAYTDGRGSSIIPCDEAS